QPGSNNCDNCEFGTNACNKGSLHHGSEDDDTTLDATLSTDESEESSSLSEGDSSRSSESEDFKESEEQVKDRCANDSCKGAALSSFVDLHFEEKIKDSKETRADLMNMKHFNGKCACHLCKSEGKGYGLNNIHKCWPFQQNLEKRTHEDQLTYASKATRGCRKSVVGVKGHSIFAKLLYPFDLIRSFAINWMHSVCLGVLKYIMQRQMSDRNRDKPFYLGAKKASISHQLKAARHCRKIAQIIRRSETLESHRTEELAIALFGGRFEKQIKFTVCFSLVFVCFRILFF
ncbi:unnamed protein product, partial [Porites lobata]